MANERLATNLHNLARDVSFVSGKVSPDSFLRRRSGGSLILGWLWFVTQLRAKTSAKVCPPSDLAARQVRQRKHRNTAAADRGGELTSKQL